MNIQIFIYDKQENVANFALGFVEKSWCWEKVIAKMFVVTMKRWLMMMWTDYTEM